MDGGFVIGIATGISIGTAVGVATGNLPAGIGAGVALGAGLGLAFSGTKKSQDETTFDNLKHKQKGHTPGDTK